MIYRSVPTLLIGLTLLHVDRVAAQGEVVITYNLESSIITLGQPVMLKIRLTNTSMASQTVDLGVNYVGNLALSIRDPNGHRTDLPRLLQKGSGGVVELGPKQDWSTVVSVADWIRPAAVGLYLFDVHQRHTLPTLREANSLLDLTVEPRDPARLASVCEDLERTIYQRDRASMNPESNNLTYAERAGFVRAAYDSARALASVRDSVCVPSVERVLENTSEFDWLLIPSLGRTNSAEAIKLLTEWATGGEQETDRLRKESLHERAVMAQGALFRLKSNIPSDR